MGKTRSRRGGSRGSTSDGQRRPTVLIVDDDDEMRHLLTILFETEEFDVVGQAPDGANGLVLAIRYEPDFIVLDYMMPGISGEETAELLRATTPTSRIVAFSAVLTSKPQWADAFLDKSRINEIAPMLSMLGDGASGQLRERVPKRSSR